MSESIINDLKREIREIDAVWARERARYRTVVAAWEELLQNAEKRLADVEKAAKGVTEWDPAFLQSLILDPQQRTILAVDAEKFWQDIVALKDALKGDK